MCEFQTNPAHCVTEWCAGIGSHVTQACHREQEARTYCICEDSRYYPREIGAGEGWCCKVQTPFLVCEIILYVCTGTCICLSGQKPTAGSNEGMTHVKARVLAFGSFPAITHPSDLSEACCRRRVSVLLDSLGDESDHSLCGCADIVPPSSTRYASHECYFMILIERRSSRVGLQLMPGIRPGRILKPIVAHESRRSTAYWHSSMFPTWSHTPCFPNQFCAPGQSEEN